MAETKKSPIVGILLDHIESDYHVEMIASARRVATRRSARTLILPGGALNSEGHPGRSRGFIYDFIRTSDLDGLIIMGGSLSNYCGQRGFERFLATLPQLPTVVVGMDTETKVCVAVNNHHGLAQMMDHLVLVHHFRKIAFIDGPSESSEARVRREAYEAALSRHNLSKKENLIIPGGLAREQGIDAVVHLLEDRRLAPEDLDAIVAVNDEVALGVLEELERRGISVPEQIAVVGFDDIPNAQAASPPLTTVSQRVYEQGATAMTRLLDTIVDGALLTRQELLPDLIVRHSCGCRMKLSNEAAKFRGTAADSDFSAQVDEMARSLADVAQGRLLGGQGWEDGLSRTLAQVVAGKKTHSSLVGAMEQLARRGGSTGFDVCHEVLTRLRVETLRRLPKDAKVVPILEDAFQEARLAIANVSLFFEREHHAAQALHLRVITRACLDRVHGSDIGELAVAIEEQLPLFGIRHFIISQGSGDRLRVIARSDKSAELSDHVSTQKLGRDRALRAEHHVVVLPLSANKKQVGLVAMSYGSTDPFIFEQFRDLLGMALAVSEGPKMDS